MAVLFTIAVTIACNILFTRHYLFVSESAGIPNLGAGYWLLLALVDVLLAGIIAILVTFVISNARQILLMRRQDSFIDGVTHELRSPLAGIRLALDTLERPNVPEEVVGRLRFGMRDDVERLQLFIDHILEAGRLQNQERPFQVSATDVHAAVERCIARLQDRHIQVPRPVEMVSELPDEQTVETDPVALEIALLNLLDNAAKYSEPGTAIRVYLRHGSNEVTISVQDEGIGLEKRELKRVFNRFYRVTTAAQLARGTGLGLFVSRQLMRQLGGNIHGASEGAGKGASFTVSLPLETK
ncbi:MAG: signal transduction histidine kinase [Bradymonadia bacterium]|jgi:signal transduction histidine kinase